MLHQGGLHKDSLSLRQQHLLTVHHPGSVRGSPVVANAQSGAGLTDHEVRAELLKVLQCQQHLPPLALCIP